MVTLIPTGVFFSSFNSNNLLDVNYISHKFTTMAQKLTSREKKNWNKFKYENENTIEKTGNISLIVYQKPALNCTETQCLLFEIVY